jgi:hypothetical protein
VTKLHHYSANNQPKRKCGGVPWRRRDTVVKKIRSHHRLRQVECSWLSLPCSCSCCCVVVDCCFDHWRYGRWSMFCVTRLCSLGGGRENTHPPTEERRETHFLPHESARLFSGRRSWLYVVAEKCLDEYKYSLFCYIYRNARLPVL